MYISNRINEIKQTAVIEMKKLFIIGFFLLFIYLCVVEVTEVVVIYLSVFPKYNNTISISYFDIVA